MTEFINNNIGAQSFITGVSFNNTEVESYVQLDKNKRPFTGINKIESNKFDNARFLRGLRFFINPTLLLYNNFKSKLSSPLNKIIPKLSILLIIIFLIGVFIPIDIFGFYINSILKTHISQSYLTTVILKIILQYIIVSFSILWLFKGFNKSDAAQFHGAEHKLIQCFMDKKTLILDNISAYSIKSFHCSSVFMSMLLYISLFEFSFIDFYIIDIRYLLISSIIKILCLVINMSVLFEIFMFLSKSKFGRVLLKPFMNIQSYLVSEPSEYIVVLSLRALLQITKSY